MARNGDPADFDPNAWYAISEARVEEDDESLGTTLQIKDGGLRVFPMVDAKWQMQPVDDVPGRYLMRYQGTGVYEQLGVCRFSDEVSQGRTRACMVKATSEDNQKWQIESFGDHTYKMINVANGTDYQLDVHPGSHPFMNHEIQNKTSEAYFPAQHWIWSSSAEVNDGAYSTIYSDIPSSTNSAQSTGASAAATTSSDGSDEAAGTTGSAEGSQNSSTSDDNNSGGGLSVGAAAGIGVGATLAVIGLLAVVAFVWWRKRKGRSTKVPQSDDSHDGSHAPGYYYGGNPNDKSGAPTPGIAEKDTVLSQSSGHTPPPPGSGYNNNAYGGYSHEMYNQQIHEAPVPWHAELDGYGQPGAPGAPGMNSVQNTPTAEFAQHARQS